MVDISEKLITDDDAAELLMREYAAKGSPVDAVAKARVWQKLEGNLAARRWRLIGSGCAALLAAGLAFVIIQPTTTIDDEQRIKGPDSSALAATLTAFQLQADGSLESLSPENNRVSVRSGASLVFKVRAATPGYFTVLLADDDRGLRRTDAAIAPLSPMETLVTTGSAVFGYRLEAAKKLQVCVVAAATKAQVETLAARPPANLEKNFPEACISW